MVKKEDESSFWYIKNVFLGSRKNIITTIATAAILGISGFIYSRAYLPAEEKKINSIQIDIQTIKQDHLNDVIEKELMKKDIKSIMKTNDEVKRDFIDAIREVTHRLDKIYDRTDETNKNIKSMKR